MKKSICLYFQVHQPTRLRLYRFFDIGKDSHYYDDFANRTILKRIAQKCYLPMNELLLQAIEESKGAFKVAFSITGSALEQFDRYAPEVIDSFRRLAATGSVEFLGETYYHSLASLASHAEFKHQVEKHKVKQLMVFDGLGKASVDTVRCGDICAVVGIDGFEIGDTIADLENPEALPPISIDEPTMSMLFTINNSPFFGRDGKFVTSRHIKDRLEKELEKNLALKVKPGQNADSFIVYGRGVLHLSVLIEEMRREGFELQVGQPKVLDKTINGQRCEPIEDLSIEVPEQFVGAAIDLSTRRKGALIHMEPRGDRTLLQFDIPTRGLMGLRSNLLTATQGEAIMAHRYKEYQPYKGEIDNRTNGSLVSLETGDAIAYSMNKLLDRGKFFVDPGEEIYCGEVVGEHTRERDLNINICKTKKLTNVRAAGSDEKIVLPPPVKMSLEEMLEYIREDELVEVTPHHMRIRKILLDPMDRKRSGNGGDDE